MASALQVLDCLSIFNFMFQQLCTTTITTKPTVIQIGIKIDAIFNGMHNARMR